MGPRNPRSSTALTASSLHGVSSDFRPNPRGSGGTFFASQSEPMAPMSEFRTLAPDLGPILCDLPGSCLGPRKSRSPSPKMDARLLAERSLAACFWATACLVAAQHGAPGRCDGTFRAASPPEIRYLRTWGDSHSCGTGGTPCPPCCLADLLQRFFHVFPARTHGPANVGRGGAPGTRSGCLARMASFGTGLVAQPRRWPSTPCSGRTAPDGRCASGDRRGVPACE